MTLADCRRALVACIKAYSYSEEWDAHWAPNGNDKIIAGVFHRGYTLKKGWPTW